MNPLCAQYLRQAEALKADMTDSKLGPAEVWTSRQALQDLYQKMLVTDLEYALDKKVEQDLWNHAFKNQITTLQGQAKNRANPNRSEVQANLSLFLEAASGFYTQLLQELCTVFNVDLPCRVKSSQLGIISNKQCSTSGIVKPQPSSCSYICQHCLVHLGDIARYRNQTSQAESYYRHAAQLVPSNGQPYNQLAILASSKGDHLTTIFYYCRSIAVKFPFPAASTNLQKALSKALESRDDMKTKWNVSDFIKTFIKFHGHVYLAKSLEKLCTLREKLEDQFKRLLPQKAFSSQQLVHLTVINLFELHHLRDFSTDSDDHRYSQEELLCWTQLLGLFMSFLGVMCKCALQDENLKETLGECPLPAVKVSLDWLKLRPNVFQESPLEERQYIWPWIVSLLNSFHPQEDDLSGFNATPLPEEFELQGFLALRPSLRNLDFSSGHQGIVVDKEGQQLRTRHQRLLALGKWIAENHSRLIQSKIEEGKLLFVTDIPELVNEDSSELKDSLILLEPPFSEPSSIEIGQGLKSVLSSGKTQSNSSESGEKLVTFKENIKPREQNRNHHPKEGMKERWDYNKGNDIANKMDVKRDSNKRKTEPKKNNQDKNLEHARKQNVAVQVKTQTDMRKTPVSEARKTPVTQSQNQTSNSQFIPIHHPGAFPPLPSRPGFPPPPYLVSPPVTFQMTPGYTFPPGVSIPGPFLQATSHPQSGNQVPGGKQSHVPYSQQRPSGQGPINQGSQQQQPQQHQVAQSQSQLQVQVVNQQSPTKAAQQLGKNQHHLGPQQYLQADQTNQLWNQHHAVPSQHQKTSIQMSLKQQPYYMHQDPLKLFEKSLHQQSQQVQMEKNLKPFTMEPFTPNPSDVQKLQDFAWDYEMRHIMGPQLSNDRMVKRQPGVFRADQDSMSRMQSYEMPNRSRIERPSELITSSSLLSLPPFSLNQENSQNNSIFSEVYGKNLAPSGKSENALPQAFHEASCYSLFDGNPWSPSLPASSDHSTPASQSPHSSNPSSLPSSPPTHNQNSFSGFGPIGTPDNSERRLPDRWNMKRIDKPVTVMSGFGLDYLPAASSSSDNTWHQGGTPSNTWAAPDTTLDDSSTLLMDSFKSIWSSSMMHPGPSALEQLLMQQKQKQQRGLGTLNPPH
ncbi:nonsense-mediated mRNA decay factor SMG7 isoform X1 [Hemiscyllium ocellatum]|uniref:nonsense-mediated mRNA decay factor SMG7 isoform X1 n=1 Tax=Hemiscyllium ocellatum TaxID=170820 RepID=UPI002966C34A|nr:nonsense-mediated mRNA decay factor SMG7 isoform X1 [Hemiscyllium ocellatum]